MLCVIAMSELFLVLFLVFLDVMFPHVYRLFRIDIRSANYNFVDLYRRYKPLSIPRTPLLVAILCMVIFAPKDMANNIVLLAVLVALFVLYVIFAIVDSNRTIAQN